MDFSILKHWVENRQLLCRFSLSLFQALGSWGRARKKREGTLSVVGGERKRRASEEKMGKDCLGSWGQAKKACANLKNQHAINLS